MSSTLSEGHLVDQVVSILTNPLFNEEGQLLELKDQLQRAAEEFDLSAAEAFAGALVNGLCEDPGDVRRLEALLILGLAHPSILDKYHISLTAEGRRLCVLLEDHEELDRARALLELLAARLPDDRQIEQDLASMMRRCGDVDDLVERCLNRADEAVQAGRPMDAIPWLQEVLLHDQSRRDVARMIRDLRYQEVETRDRSRSRNRVILILLVVFSTLSAVFLRERGINKEYGQLPPMVMDSEVALDARIAGIDSLIASNRIWFGMLSIVGERRDLSAQKDRLDAMEAEVQRVLLAEVEQNSVEAEALRLRAIDAVMGADYQFAKDLFERSLVLSTEDWDRRPRIEANIVALDDLLSERK